MLVLVTSLRSRFRRGPFTAENTSQSSSPNTPVIFSEITLKVNRLSEYKFFRFNTSLNVPSCSICTVADEKGSELPFFSSSSLEQEFKENAAMTAHANKRSFFI